MGASGGRTTPESRPALPLQTSAGLDWNPVKQGGSKGVVPTVQRSSHCQISTVHLITHFLRCIGNEIRYDADYSNSTQALNGNVNSSSPESTAMLHLSTILVTKDSEPEAALIA